MNREDWICWWHSCLPGWHGIPWQLATVTTVWTVSNQIRPAKPSSEIQLYPRIWMCLLGDFERVTGEQAVCEWHCLARCAHQQHVAGAHNPSRRPCVQRNKRYNLIRRRQWTRGVRIMSARAGSLLHKAISWRNVEQYVRIRYYLLLMYISLEIIGIQTEKRTSLVLKSWSTDNYLRDTALCTFIMCFSCEQCSMFHFSSSSQSLCSSAWNWFSDI